MAASVQLRDVFRPGCLFQVHRFVRTPGRQHRYRETLVPRQLFMPFQRIRRIVRGADGIHVAHHDQAPGGISFALQLRVGQFPYFPGGILVQDSFIAEESAQLQMAPVIQGIADRLANNLRELVKLFPVGSVAGNILFRHPGRPHQAPLVVVPSQPDLGNVLIPDILPDFPGIQVAVIVNDRLSFRRFMIQLFRRFRIQQKIFVQEHFHLHFLPA